MRKSAKIGISALVVVGVGLLISACLNTWMRSLVRRQLDQNIAAADSLCITYGDIRLTVLTGKAWIKDVYFRSDTMLWEDVMGPVAEVRVDEISLDGINYYNWLVKRQLNLRGLTVVNPTFRMRFNHKLEKEKGDVLQQQVQQLRKERLEKVLNVARIFIDDATLDRLTIDHGSVRAEAINDSLRVVIPEFTVSIYDLGYNIKDLVPHYNDSVFHFLFRNIDVNIPKVPMSLTVNELLSKPSGVLQVRDVWVKSYLNSSLTEHVTVGVEQVHVGGFDVAKFNTIKQMDIRNIHLINPMVSLHIDESSQATKQRQNQTQLEIDALNQKMVQSNLDVVTEFITGLTVDTIFLHDAKINVRSSSTHFYLQANRISTAVYGVGYSLIDDIPYHYNDSVYQFYVGDVNIITPDSILAITAQDMRYDNGGAFTLGKTHIRHIVNKWKLAHMMGDVPVTLMDMHLDSLYTSSKNIVKEVYTLENGFYLDTLWANVNTMTIFRDARYGVKEPFHLPQYYLMQLNYPFVVNCVNANIGKIYINMALTKQHIGKLDLGPIDLKISNVTPIRNSTITTIAKGKMGKADINAVFNLKVNRACNWDIVLNAKNMDAHHLDQMVYPIVGMKIGCDIHRIRAQYAGDSELAKGTFCMEYDDVDIFADKNSNPPIKVVRDLSGLINSAGKTIVNKANPACPGKQPVVYHVQWKNNKMVNPAMFYVGPVVDGCVKTMLPGLFLRDRVKTNQPDQP